MTHQVNIVAQTPQDSAEFELYIIKDYQRLKADENSRISLDWNVKRLLAKVNYRIHTDAIRDNLIPPELTPKQKSFVYKGLKALNSRNTEMEADE